MEVTTSPPSLAGESSRGNPFVRWTAITLAVGLAVAWVVMKRIQAAQAKADRNDLRPAPCPTCGATLKYRQRDVGLTGSCPACGEQVTYAPPPPEPETPGPESHSVKAWHEAMKRARAARRRGPR
jgi:hypothetical protein